MFLKQHNVFIIKALSVLAVAFIAFTTHAQSVVYSEHFFEKGLRLEYFRTGNSDTTIVSFHAFAEQPYWSGARNKLIEPFGYGEHKIQIWDKSQTTLLFSKTYSSLYFEWQATEEAKIAWRSFEGSIAMPYPKNESVIKLFSSTPENVWFEQLSITFKPDDIFISRENYPSVKVKNIHNSGHYSEKLDILFISEGYKEEEMHIFQKNMQDFTNQFFNEPPFDKNRNNINIWAAEVPSLESGTDIAGKNIWKNTALGSGFYTFGSDRYLTTPDIQTVNAIAAAAPADQIIILVNSSEYGGGGIYNFYAITTALNPHSFNVLVHEFGHSFGGLADEYYTSDVAYEELHPLHVEPKAPNITTLVNFDLKWKHLLAENTPIPTPPSQEWIEVIGVFEGGGYRAKGIYRPAFNCYMKALNAKGFCEVCQYSLQQVIDFYRN